MTKNIKDTASLAIGLLIVHEVITEVEFEDAKIKGHDGIYVLLEKKLREHAESQK